MRTGGYYGKIGGTYWTGPMGRAIQRDGGQAATLLGAYLLTNAHATMIGFYRIAIDTIAEETPLTVADVTDGFTVLQTHGFAGYDATAEVVWVIDMAADRLGLTPERPTLALGDRRVVMVNRLYGNLVENLWTEEFYTVYAQPLHLNRLRSCTHDPQQLGLPALNRKILNRINRKSTAAARRDVRKRQTTKEPDEPVPSYHQPMFGSFALYTLLAKDAITKAQLEDDDSLGNVTDHFKRLCTLRRLSYEGDLTTRAIAAALGDRRRR